MSVAMQWKAQFMVIVKHQSPHFLFFKGLLAHIDLTHRTGLDRPD